MDKICTYMFTKNLFLLNLLNVNIWIYLVNYYYISIYLEFNDKFAINITSEITFLYYYIVL